MFQHILAPLDGSALAEGALLHAAAVGRAFGARISLVRILDSEGARDERSMTPLDWDVLRAEAQSYLAGQVSRLEKAGAAVQAHVLEGSAAGEIVEFVARQNIDLVVLSSHGRGGLNPWAGGGTAQKILWRAGVSVLLIPAFRPPADDLGLYRYEKLLLPLDISPRCEFALPIASRLARHHQARVIIAHVVHEPSLPRRAPLSAEEHELVQKLMQLNQENARRDLEDLAKRLSLPEQSIDIRLLTGQRPAESLHNLVDQETPDLLIMAAHGYSAGIRWPYGGTVATFILYGSVPLLITQDLRPEEFKPSAAAFADAQKKGH